MSKSKNIEEKKLEIEQIGLDAILRYFMIDPLEIDHKILKVIHDKARLAMQFEREMMVSNRAVEMNYLSVFRLVAEDKKDLKMLIKRSLPQYLK